MAQVLGVPTSLTDPLGTAHEAAIRDVCGVLVKSPQFLLEGLPPAEPLPAQPPSLLVCGAADVAPCDALARCGEHAALASDLGFTQASCAGL